MSMNQPPDDDPEEEIVETTPDGYLIKRGNDAFSGGGTEVIPEEPSQSDDLLGNVMSDPVAFLESLKPSQANIEDARSFGIVGGLGGVIHRVLSPHIGDLLSGLIGGVTTGYIASKTRKGRRPRR